MTVARAALGAGEVKSAKEVLDRRKLPGGAMRTPAEQQVDKLGDAFSRTSKASKKQFALLYRAELTQLLGELPAQSGTTAEVVSFTSKQEAG